jgi:fatty-acid desaturase
VTLTETEPKTDENYHKSTAQSLNWPVALVIGGFHVAAVGALFVFSWKLLAASIFLYWIATGLGISMGYHRLHTHRSYKVPLFLVYFLAICGNLTREGGAITWVATHRIHHQN